MSWCGMYRGESSNYYPSEKMLREEAELEEQKDIING